VASGHLETEFLSYASTEEEAKTAVGRMRLNDVKAQLDSLIRAKAKAQRPWWEAMNDEGTA
jgi:hypothetical protein